MFSGQAASQNAEDAVLQSSCGKTVKKDAELRGVCLHKVLCAGPRQHERPSSRPESLRIYEAHVGMSSEEPAVASYTYFKGSAPPSLQSQMHVLGSTLGVVLTGVAALAQTTCCRG